MEITPIVKCGTDLKDLNIYIKRDDLIPFSFGGNKVRIAEEFYNDMILKECDCMIGYGNSRSNLSRAIANMNSKNSKSCIIISPSDDDGSRIITNNTRLVNACNVSFVECNKTNVSKTVEEVIKKCEQKGLKPYYIYGNKFGEGNETVPVRAYMKAYEEILIQEREIGINFDYIFLATGTGMTQSGLLVGQILANRYNQKIIGISVARERKKEEAIIKHNVELTLNEMNLKGNKRIPKVTVLDDYLCEGYGNYNENIVELIKNMYISNGLPLDTTYTGKAFYGMLDYLKSMNKKNVNILFIHTGGTPLFFDAIDLIQ